MYSNIWLTAIYQAKDERKAPCGADLVQVSRRLSADANGLRSFSRCKPSDSDCYRRIRRLPVQHSSITKWLPDPTNNQGGFLTPMSRWLPDAAVIWAPVPYRLADHKGFRLYMSLVENTAEPWFKLSMFGIVNWLAGIIRHSGLLAVCCQNIHQVF